MSIFHMRNTSEKYFEKYFLSPPHEKLKYFEMIETTVVCLKTKAGWSEDIVMEGIWWQEIRMNATDFRGRPSYQTVVRPFIREAHGFL